MDLHAEIAVIETELKQMGATIGDLCLAADIAPSTWSRWKRDVAPRPRLWRRVQRAFVQLRDSCSQAANEPALAQQDAPA